MLLDWWEVLIMMFATLGLLMASGMPIAFAFGVLNVVLLYFLVGGVGALQAIALSSFSSVGNFSFIALPLFVFMGELVLHSGLATLAIDAIGKWLGRIPGRLAVMAVLAGTAFAAGSGSSMASAATLGTILIPEMRKNGYDKGLTVGTLATSGALAILIPPSALMVIFGGISQLSVGDLLIGGILPGLLLASLLFGYIVVISIMRPHLAPSAVLEDVSWAERLQALKNFAPLVALVMIVLGSIFVGVATPSESAAMGAGGAFLLAAAYHRLSIEGIRNSLFGTVEVSGFALLIVTSATAFSQILAHSGAAAGLTLFATALPVPTWVIIGVMQAVILVMGCFMEPVSIMLITVPIFFPIIQALGLDPLWFAIVTMVNIELSMITPPFGLNLFILKGVCPPDTTLEDIYRGVIPFILLNLLALGLVIWFPPLATWLPNLMH
ncbi:MAG TPA: TRAP transporter large permease subunit [Candidatus Binatia bacterium]